MRLAEGEDSSSASNSSKSSNNSRGGARGEEAVSAANISRIPTNANLALEDTNSRDGREEWLHRAQVHVGQRNGAGPPLPAPPKELTHHAVGSSRVSEKRIQLSLTKLAELPFSWKINQTKGCSVA